MPSIYLQRNFKPNHYYHIFNRGGFKQKIFLEKSDYLTFLDILRYYLLYPKQKSIAKTSKTKLKKAQSRSVIKPYKLLAYCLMPNHFHLLLFQTLLSPTLTNLLRKVTVTYAMYFQNKYNHSGALFQGRFKCVRIFSNEQLLYLTKYIHLNPQKSEGSVLSNYPYSSLPNYLHLIKTNKNWLDCQTIYNKFFPHSKNPVKNYQFFLSSKQNQAKLEKLLKRKTLE